MPVARRRRPERPVLIYYKIPTTPGPKPKFIVIEENLHWQKKGGGEIVLDLDIPFKTVPSTG